MNCSGVVLVGPRGAGKTTVGRQLAQRIRLPFVDGDTAVSEHAGATVAELLFAGTFREQEARAMEQLLTGPPVVLAAGGGVVLWRGFAAAVRTRPWRVFWLDAPATVLAARIAGSDRPSLTGAPPEEEIAALAAARAPLYAAVAEQRIDTGRDDSGTIAKRIGQLLKNAPKRGSRSAD